MKRELLVTFLSLGMLLGTCQDSGDGGGTTGQIVGSVLDVFSATGFLEGAVTAPGDGIPADSLIETDGSGELEFDVKGEVNRCRLFPTSRVRVRPSPSYVLRVKEGRTWCSKDADVELELHFTTTNAELAVNDPVFGMEVLEKGSVVKVALGFVLVRSLETSGDQAVLVGPGQQSVVPAGEDPLPAGPLELEPAETEVVDSMIGGSPPPDLGPPDPAASPTLARILERGAIVVGVDETQLVDGVDSFVDTFMGELAKQWGIGSVRRVDVSPESGLKGLEAGDLDVFVTPTPIDGPQTIPYFLDPQGRLWSLALGTDDQVFAEGITRYLAGVLTIGSYGTMYTEAFGIEPTYDPLRSVLGI